jgi:transposase
MAAMSGSILTLADRACLLRTMRRQTPSPVHRRMNALLLLDDGWAAERVADALFIDAGTVREPRRLYETAGGAGLERLNHEGSDPALSEAQLGALKTELDAHLYVTAKEVCDFVQRTFEVDCTPNAMTRLLKRLGLVYRWGLPQPRKLSQAVHLADRRSFPYHRSAKVPTSVGTRGYQVSKGLTLRCARFPNRLT